MKIESLSQKKPSRNNRSLKRKKHSAFSGAFPALSLSGAAIFCNRTGKNDSNFCGMILPLPLRRNIRRALTVCFSGESRAPEASCRDSEWSSKNGTPSPWRTPVVFAWKSTRQREVASSIPAMDDTENMQPH